MKRRPKSRSSEEASVAVEGDGTAPAAAGKPEAKEEVPSWR